MRAIYGLPQSGYLANQYLIKKPRPIWIPPIQNNTRSMAPKKIPIKFNLLVYYFGVNMLTKTIPNIY